VVVVFGGVFGAGYVANRVVAEPEIVRFTSSMMAGYISPEGITYDALPNFFQEHWLLSYVGIAIGVVAATLALRTIRRIGK